MITFGRKKGIRSRQIEEINKFDAILKELQVEPKNPTAVELNKEEIVHGTKRQRRKRKFEPISESNQESVEDVQEMTEDFVFEIEESVLEKEESTKVETELLENTLKPPQPEESLQESTKVKTSIFDLFENTQKKSPSKRIHLLAKAKPMKQTKLSLSTDNASRQVNSRKIINTKTAERLIVPVRQSNLVTFSDTISQTNSQYKEHLKIDCGNENYTFQMSDNCDIEQESDLDGDEFLSKGMHEIFQAGVSKRKGDDLEYILQGLDSTLRVVQGSLLDIIRKTRSSDFCNEMKAKCHLKTLFSKVYNTEDYLVKYELLFICKILMNEFGVVLFLNILSGIDFMDFLFKSAQYFENKVLPKGKYSKCFVMI
jgi:hypothetical protein